MKGFTIEYRDGESDVINSDAGYVAECIEFEEYDELVGITVDQTSENDKKPRRIGFTIMRKQ